MTEPRSTLDSAEPGVMTSIVAQSHAFVEIDSEIFSTVILLFPLIQEALEIMKNLENQQKKFHA